MLYLAYQAHSDMIEPAKSMARTSLAMLGAWGSAANVPLVRNLSATYELIARAGLTHERPPYGIEYRQGRQPRGPDQRGPDADPAVRHAS